MEYIEVKSIIFKGKQNIPWADVERYLGKYEGQVIRVKETGDEIRINALFSDEYVHSQYTRKLRGALAKVKANIVQIIPELVENGVNRRWSENKESKHSENAKKGWYRYDSFFSVRVYEQNSEEYRLNYYCATIIVRINDTGKYLYDIINIKKEARKPTDC